MDFNAAIVAHKKWKDKLWESVQSDTPLDPLVVAKDTGCPLGQWIQTAGKECGTLIEYQTLREKHSRFHLAAADTVRQIHGLPKEQAGAVLHGKTPFSAASAACVNAIAALRDKLNAA